MRFARALFGAGATVSHAEAREIVRRAWVLVWGRQPTERELDYAQAIALLETGYGRAGQFAALAAQGKFNWGALQRARNTDGSCPPGTEPGLDASHPRCFLVFPSDEEAAAAFLRNLTKRHWPVVEAMRGEPIDVARAMKVPPAYYEAPVEEYARAISNALARIHGAGGVSSSSAAPSGPSAGQLVAGAAIAGAAGYLAWENRAELARFARRLLR